MGVWNELWKVRETRSDVPPATNSGDNQTARRAPSRTEVPITVDGREALTLSSVYRAVSLITTSVKQCSVDLYRGDTKLSGQQVPTWLKAPDSDLSARAFYELTTASLALRGNAYWRIYRDSKGAVLNVKVLNPANTLVQTDPKTGAITHYLSGTDTIPAFDVKHLKLNRRPGETYGLGPVEASSRDLRSAIDTRNFGTDIFGRSGIPTKGYLKAEQDVSPETRKVARDAWTDAVADPDGVPVLGNGMDYKSVQLSPRDAQWIESQKFSTTGIARVFGIPANLLLADVEGTSQTYANVSQSWTEFARFCLMAYFTEIEDALSILVPGVGVARFNLEALLRPDTQTRYATYATATWMTKNEIRALEGLPPLEGGDTLSAPVAPPAPTDGGTDG